MLQPRLAYHLRVVDAARAFAFAAHVFVAVGHMRRDQGDVRRRRDGHRDFRLGWRLDGRCDVCRDGRRGGRRDGRQDDRPGGCLDGCLDGCCECKMNLSVVLNVFVIRWYLFFGSRQLSYRITVIRNLPQTTPDLHCYKSARNFGKRP